MLSAELSRCLGGRPRRRGASPAALAGGFGTHHLWNEIGMLAQPVTGTLDLNNDSVVKKSVQQRSRDDGIAKNFPPFAEAAIGGQDHRASLVAGVDQLEEQIAGAGADGEIADLIDNQQRGATEEADAFA